MAGPSTNRGDRGPRAPHPVAVDLPEQLRDVRGLRSRVSLVGVRIDALGGDVTAAHSHLSQSHLDGPSVDRLDLTGATLTDVRVSDLRIADMRARESSWRTVEAAGGRVGSLDGGRGVWDGVALRGLRIDYLSLPGARLTDVSFIGCDIGTLDVPEATLTRVRFEDCRADEVDTRGLRPTDVDARGLEALSFTDPRGLRGVTMLPRHAQAHAEDLARALGIDLRS